MLDLKMEVYTPALDLIGFLEIQRSVIWGERAFTAGSFSVESLITVESMSMLQPENIIWIEGDTAGIIEYVHKEADQNGPYIVAKGCTLTGILDRRILWGLYNLKGTAPEIMHYLVNECCINPTRGDIESRKIPGLVMLDAPTGGDQVQVQATGGTLLERLETLGETYGVAFGVRFNPAIPQMEFWTRWGQDRSIYQDVNPPVLYSTELDDVLASEYLYNSENYRNVSLVAGEGEGDKRVYVTVENYEDTPEPVPPTPPEPPVTQKYTVTLLVDPAGGGIASGGKTVAAGVSITVTASPSEGYKFAEWQENGETVSKNANYTFTVNSDRTLTAVFSSSVPSAKKITVKASDSSSLSSLFTAGTLMVAGVGITSATTTIETTEDVVSVSFELTKDIKISRSMAVNGTNIGHVGEAGDKASTDLTATDGMTITIAFTPYTPSRLPDGYTEIEYIESSEGQYIDTGRKPVSTTKLSLDVEMLSDATSTAKFIWGSSVTGYWFFGTWSTSGVRVTDCASTTSSASYKVLSKDVSPRRMLVTVDYVNKTASIKGESEINLTGNLTSTNMTTLKLLSGSSGTASSSASARLYSAKLEDSKADSEYVPCINPSGQAGLYDIVGGKFYGNAGSGTFTAGPAI